MIPTVAVLLPLVGALSLVGAYSTCNKTTTRHESGAAASVLVFSVAQPPEISGLDKAVRTGGYGALLHIFTKLFKVRAKGPFRTHHPRFNRTNRHVQDPGDFFVWNVLKAS